VTGTAGHPDLASRALGGAVVFATDDFFADRANLVNPDPPRRCDDFGPRGKVYDGWETRRRRDGGPEPDHAIVRLGAAGIVRGVVVDTAYFLGNYPPHVSVEATALDGYPSPPELQRAEWTVLVPRSPAEGGTANSYPVDDGRRWTHVRLSIYPDGGVARLRVPGEVVPDPCLMTGTVDLAAAGNGGRVVACSNLFYSEPGNLLRPGPARSMGEGWETARRRTSGNDWVVVRLGGAGVLREVELDTSHFLGNAPGAARVTGLCGTDWTDLLPETRLQPDTRHRFRVSAAGITQVRVDILPDGGFARLRVRGELTGPGWAALVERWWGTLPAGHRARVLAALPGLDPDAPPDLAQLAARLDEPPERYGSVTAQ